MKNLTILLIFLPFICISQPEFSFDLYFEDALGNRDTVTIGYDPEATDGIDAQFGEENIITQPWDSVFEVRISNSYERNALGEQASFNTKKNITTDLGSPFFFIDKIEIDIFAKHFPIKISCDSTLLQSPERSGTFITSMLPGGWFDTGGFVTNLFYNPQTLIDLPGYESWPYYPFNYYYLEETDSVYVCWAVIADSNTNTSNIHENEIDNIIRIFPNPTNKYFEIKTEVNVQKIEIANSYGQVMQEFKATNQQKFDISQYSDGIYLITIYLENQIKHFKIIKK